MRNWFWHLPVLGSNHTTYLLCNFVYACTSLNLNALICTVESDTIKNIGLLYKSRTSVF